MPILKGLLGQAKWSYRRALAESYVGVPIPQTAAQEQPQRFLRPFSPDGGSNVLGRSLDCEDSQKIQNSS